MLNNQVSFNTFLYIIQIKILLIMLLLNICYIQYCYYILKNMYNITNIEFTLTILTS